MHDYNELERLLSACARGDLAATVRPRQAAPARDYELFTAAACRWVDRVDQDVNGDVFLQLVAARKWHALLMQFLLQHHVRDAIDSMRDMLAAHQHLTRQHVVYNALPILDALLATIAAFWNAQAECGERDSDHFDLLLQDEVARCAVCLQPRLPLLRAERSSSAGVLPKEMHDNAVLERIIELPTALDAVTFDSKLHEAVYAAATPLVVQQQRTLAETYLQRIEEAACDKLLRKQLRALADELHAAVTLAVRGHVDDTSNYSQCNSCSDKDTISAGLYNDEWTLSVLDDDVALEQFLLQQRTRDIVDDDADARSGSDNWQQQLVGATTGALQDCTDNDDNLLLECARRFASQSTNAEPHTLEPLRDVVHRTRDQLAQIDSVQVLGIHVSYLLAAQAHTVESCSNSAVGDSALAVELEQQVVRAFNSLTRGTDDKRSVRSLLLVAAFCPSRVLREIVQRSALSTDHTGVFVQTLALCPVLLDWRDDESFASCVFVRELRALITSIVSDHRVFVAQRGHVLAFVRALTGLGASGGATTSETPEFCRVERFELLLQDVVLLVCRAVLCETSGDDHATYQRVIDCCCFVRMLLDAATADRRWRSTLRGTQALSALVQMFVSAYTISSHVPSAQISIECSDALLLAANDALELFEPLEQQTAVSRFLDADAIDSDSTIDDKLLMLLALYCPRDIDSAAPRLRLHNELMRHDSTTQLLVADADAIDATQASRSVRLLLWQLLWCAVRSKECPLDREAQTLENQAWITITSVVNATFAAPDSLEAVVATSVDAASSTRRRISGCALLQCELVLVLATCHSELFRVWSDCVLPRIVSLIELNTAHCSLQSLQFPMLQQAVDTSSDPQHITAAAAEIPLAFQIALPAPHVVMKAVARCWSFLVLATNRAVLPTQRVSTVSIARHFATVSDRAIASSTSSLVGLLNCLQWTCVAARTLTSCHDASNAAAWSVVQSQLDVNVLRVLHLLNQTPAATMDEATWCARFIASWIAQLPTDSFMQARNALARASL